LVHAPAAETAELLQKAIVNEKKAIPYRRIQIRTKTRKFTRPAQLRKGSDALPEAAESLSQIAALFMDANYNWEDPLSAQSFAGWREHLASKRDKVDANGNGTLLSQYQIRTTTPTGNLFSATILLRASDFQPIEARLEFSNGEFVEITPIQDAMPPDLSSLTARPQAPLQSSRSGQPKTARSITATVPQKIGPGDELSVLTALRAIGADLGDPIEIVRQEDQILVSATGLSRARQLEIEQSLAPIPHVVVRFPQIPQLRIVPETIESTVVETASRSPLEEALERLLPGGEVLHRFVDELLHNSEAMMARAHATHHLVERFPLDVERSMSPEDRHRLALLRQQHEAALYSVVYRISDSLNPSLVALGANIPDPAPTAFQDWQSEADDIFTSAQRVDRLLGQMLGHTGVGTSTTADLSRELGRLKGDLAPYSTLRSPR
jgi:hypothetical protein